MFNTDLAPAPTPTMLQRLRSLARHFGFDLYAQAYECVLGGAASNVVRGQFTPQQSLGAFFLTSIAKDVMVDSEGAPSTHPEVTIRSGSRLLTDGRVSFRQAFSISTRVGFGGWELCAPIVVKRDDSFSLEVTAAPGQTITAPQGVVCWGYHARHFDGRQPGADADDLARAVIADGEYTAGGIILSQAGDKDGYPVQMPTIYDRLSLEVRQHDAGFTSADYRVQLQNIDLFPQGLSRATLLFLETAFQGSGLQERGPWPLRLGERVDVRQTMNVPVTTSLMLSGRRYPQAAQK